MTPDPVTACLTQINVMLNWPRMYRENWPVSVTKTSLSADLVALQMPWYFDTNKNPVGHEHFDAMPVSVCQAVENLCRRPPATQYLVAKYEAIFQAGAQPIQIMLPVYRLPKDAYLLLDGNHRAVALAITGRTFEMSLVMIKGPVETAALPDLRHWEK